MSSINDLENKVGQHYNTNFEYEVDRLPKYCPVEYAVTTRLINRWIPDNAIIGEVGVGGGCYTELLAKRGCQLYLADISNRLLDRVVRLLTDQGLSRQILSAEIASGTDLHCIPGSSLDALLFMGPLYHLCTLEQRQMAVREAARVLKPGGILFAAGINRLTYLRDLFRQSPEKAPERYRFHERFLYDGNLDPEHAPPIGFAHLTTRDEFYELFQGDFDDIALLAVESFTSSWQEKFLELPDKVASAWLDLVEKTAQMPESFGIADHYLYIGKRQSNS